MGVELENERKNHDYCHEEENVGYKKGVKHLCESGITRIPSKYVLPFAERPSPPARSRQSVALPVIDLGEFRTSARSQAMGSLAKACEEYGFFQVINHGIPNDVIRGMIDVGRRFFELPYEEKEKYVSSDMSTPVRYGTSWNQKVDRVYCWRDFLKLKCPSQGQEVLPLWPSSPPEFRQKVRDYAKETRSLFLNLVELILESLGLGEEDDDEQVLKKFEDGSQIMVLNCYPSCPEPDITLGMPPHSDYGFLTLLLQDEVQGLQIQSRGEWVAIDPLPNSFVINVGDHLEIFSNGRYKSVLHRVLVNSRASRVSVASLHSLPYQSVVSPCPKLVNGGNPRRYRDTDFAAFLKYVTAGQDRKRPFLDSLRLT